MVKVSGLWKQQGFQDLAYRGSVLSVFLGLGLRFLRVGFRVKKGAEASLLRGPE